MALQPLRRIAGWFRASPRPTAMPPEPVPQAEAEVEEAAVTVEPERPSGDDLAALGDRARDRRDWAEAAVHYEQALRQRPVWPAIRVQLGNMLKECGRFADAEAAYRRAIAEEPGVADTHLQLGHALKLQNRFDQASAAYLACLTLEPASQDARTELRGLGIGRRVIERHLAAAAAIPDGDGTPMATARSRVDVTPIEHLPPAGPRGVITEIGTAHVAGVVHDVGLRDLPLILVCRHAEAVVATHVIDAPERDDGGDGPERSSFPRDVRFRLALPEAIDAAVLHLRFEPNGDALLGSPFVPLGSGPAALLDRLERLEAIVDGGLLPTDLEARLERRLSRAVTAAAGARIETLLDHQRRIFERQLLAVEDRVISGTPLPARPLGDAPATDAPRRLRIAADDGLPGLGWSPVDVGTGGRRQCWMGRQASLSLPVAPASCHLARIRLGDVASAAALDALRIAAGGEALRHWIEPATDGGALLVVPLAGRARRSDGRLDLRLACDTGDVAANTISVVGIDLEAAPPSSPVLDLPAASAWLVHGWRVEPEAASAAMIAPRAVLALPSGAQPADADLTLFGSDLPSDLVLRLDDTDLARTITDGARIEARIPAAIRRPDEPAILVLASVDAGAFSVSPSPRLTRILVTEGSDLPQR